MIEIEEEKEKDLKYRSARERAAREVVRKALNGDIEACRYIIECNDHVAEMHFQKQLSKIKIPRERKEPKETYDVHPLRKIIEERWWDEPEW